MYSTSVNIIRSYYLQLYTHQSPLSKGHYIECACSTVVTQ